jgi:hypothetical protein
VQTPQLAGSHDSTDALRMQLPATQAAAQDLLQQQQQQQHGGFLRQPEAYWPQPSLQGSACPHATAPGGAVDAAAATAAAVYRLQMPPPG